MLKRIIHFNDEEWKYKIDSRGITIQDLTGKYHRISIRDLWRTLYGFEPPCDEDDHIYDIEIKPSNIKNYIEKKLKGK